MSRDYLNKKTIYAFNLNNPVNQREPIDLTLMKIKIGFTGMAALIMLSLVVFCIIAWPWIESRFF